MTRVPDPGDFGEPGWPVRQQGEQPDKGRARPLLHVPNLGKVTSGQAKQRFEIALVQ